LIPDSRADCFLQESIILNPGNHPVAGFAKRTKTASNYSVKMMDAITGCDLPESDWICRPLLELRKIANGCYFKCLQSAIFISVISPAPEMRLISRSFLPMVSAKHEPLVADGLLPFRGVDGLERMEFF
jgi:hypothetical protein